MIDYITSTLVIIVHYMIHFMFMWMFQFLESLSSEPSKVVWLCEQILSIMSSPSPQLFVADYLLEQMGDYWTAADAHIEIKSSLKSQKSKETLSKAENSSSKKEGSQKPETHTKPKDRRVRKQELEVLRVGCWAVLALPERARAEYQHLIDLPLLLLEMLLMNTKVSDRACKRRALHSGYL